MSAIHNVANMARKLLAFLLICSLLNLLVSIESSYSAQSTTADREPEEIYGTLKAGKRIMKEREYVSADKPTAYLTFDDGPSRLTPKVLDILKAEGIQATFFALGQQSEAHPQVIRRIAQEGHSLGNHSYNHVYKELYSDFRDYWNQLIKTEDIFHNIAGVRPDIIRTPGGTHTNMDAFYFYYLDQAGYTIYDWNLDSGDARRRGVPAGEIISNVKKGPFPHELHVLMHDGAGHEETVKALPEVIRILQEKGYAFAPLSSQVKPVIFSLGKSKWQRDNSYAAYTSLSTLPDDKINHLAHQTEVSVTESTYALQLLSRPKLSLLLENEQLDLDSETYEFHNGSFYVPLRLLIESMGGHVAWNEQRRTATIRYGFYKVEYDFTAKAMNIFAAGRRAETVHLPEMWLKDNALMVPVRSTVEMLGNDIKDYTLASGERQVKIGLKGGYYPAYAKALPALVHYKS